MEKCNSCKELLNEKFNFCPYCGKEVGRPIKCFKCTFVNESNSKFCQECGSSLQDSYHQNKSNKREINTEIVNIPDPPFSGITIEFPHTSAQSFDFAVKAAQKFDSFEKYGDDKKAIFRVNFPENEVFRAKELLDQLKGWRKRTVYLNGEKVQWDSVFEFTSCYDRKFSSFKPEYYCFGYENEWEFNLWGCKRAMMPFVDNSRWFTYGKWLTKDGDWQFDKERIEHELTKNLYSYRFCPSMNPELIKEIIKALPDVVNPTRDNNWKFMESISNEGNTLPWISTRFGFERQVFINGVCPNGKGFLKEILNKIKNKIPDFIKT